MDPKASKWFEQAVTAYHADLNLKVGAFYALLALVEQVAALADAVKAQDPSFFQLQACPGSCHEEEF